jgi:hypothetical protein
MEHLQCIIFETIASGEAHSVPLEAMRFQLEQMAPQLSERVVAAVASRMNFPEVLTEAQREEIVANGVEEFKKYFLSQVAIATVVMTRANSMPVA